MTRRHSGGAGVLKGLASRTISLLWQVKPNVTINDARCARDSHDSVQRKYSKNSKQWLSKPLCLLETVKLQQIRQNFKKFQLESALDIIHSSLLPEDKAKNIQDFQNDAPTTMAEDGNNDALTLATLDVGISV
nr:putative inactive cadmium/zinc-transporting ATPase HMA3 [Tanacetum cinerariifolium]